MQNSAQYTNVTTILTEHIQNSAQNINVTANLKKTQ